MSVPVMEGAVTERRLRVIRPSMPQVDLLPPEVRSARSLRTLKRGLLLGTVAVIVACGGGFVLAGVEVVQARGELLAAQGETARLQAEQQQYAEVPPVLAALDRASGARELGMSTEVHWTAYLRAIAAVLPPAVSLESFTVSGATPMLAPPVPTDPLQGPSVGQIQFTGRSATVPDTAAWVDALNSISGFSDAWVSAVTAEESEGATFYTVESTVQFTEAAYDDRFVEEGE